jgi:ribosome-binding factor A
MSSGRRADRVADLLREALADLLLREIKDPRIGMVTITAVEMTDDLRHARVYFSTVGDEPARQRSLRGLQSAAGFIRREVSHKLQLRYAPEITFQLDSAPERAQRVSELLHGQEGTAGDDPQGPRHKAQGSDDED